MVQPSAVASRTAATTSASSRATTMASGKRAGFLPFQIAAWRACS